MSEAIQHVLNKSYAKMQVSFRGSLLWKENVKYFFNYEELHLLNAVTTKVSCRKYQGVQQLNQKVIIMKPFINTKKHSRFLQLWLMHAKVHLSCCLGLMNSQNISRV